MYSRERMARVWHIVRRIHERDNALHTHILTHTHTQAHTRISRLQNLGGAHLSICLGRREKSGGPWRDFFENGRRFPEREFFEWCGLHGY